MPDNYLSHHGILGQKWGIRRYQNPDGSLTSAGKARYREDGTKLTLDNMTDDEYEYAMARMKKEKEFKDTRASARGTSSINIGSDAVKIGAAVVASAAVMYLTEALSDDGITDGKKLAKKILLAASTTAITGLATSVGADSKSINSGNKSNNSGVGAPDPNISAKVGKPTNPGTYDNAAWSKLLSNYNDEEKTLAKKLRKQGYDQDQIEKYFEHSDSSEILLMNLKFEMAGIM